LIFLYRFHLRLYLPQPLLQPELLLRLSLLLTFFPLQPLTKVLLVLVLQCLSFKILLAFFSFLPLSTFYVHRVHLLLGLGKSLD
jgi:hypothetical protein